jgi:NAD(P)-dependent dehydrogenase (short-subunit alcohol dehydrogenase family)
MSTARIVITTGANSGIGLATALEVARRDMHSVATVRSAAKADLVKEAAAEAGVGVETAILDVTDRVGCAELIERYEPWGIVNNAGFSASGAVEDVGDDEVAVILETMVAAPIRLARLAIPHMRRAGSGRIVNVSSIYGFTTTPLTGWYQASKHAIEGVSDALRAEVAADGIKVVLIQPGGIRTGIWDEFQGEVSARAGSRYAGAYGRLTGFTRGFEPIMRSPEQVAKVIANALTSSHPRARYLVGPDAHAIAVLEPLSVTSVRDRLSRLILGL